MVEENRKQIELNEIIDKQKKKIRELEGKAVADKSFSDYVAETSYYSNMPDDPYSHQFQLLHKPHRDVQNFGDLLDSDILLSNIQGSRTMILFQRDFHYLTRMFDMSKRSLGIQLLFKPLYYSWKGQLRMTSALKGKERSLQSFIEPEYEPSGFSFPLRKNKKKKKNLTDFLTPEDQGIYE